MTLHTGIIITPSGLSGELNTIATAISNISDGVITKIVVTVTDRFMPADIGTPTGLNEHSGLFLSTDDSDNIYTIIVPAIAPDMITTTGLMSGVLLTDEAIANMQHILDAIPVVSDALAAVGNNPIIGSVVS